MSHLKKLEQVLDLLINEETDQATDLLHDIVVEKARQIYEDLVDNETMGEEFGGDVDTDYAEEVAQSEDDIDTDELQDMDHEGSEGEEMPEEEELEGRLEDLEGQFAELQARFAELSGEDDFDSEDTNEFGDEEEGITDTDSEVDSDIGEYDDADEEFEESMYEATKLSNDVSIDMKGEGKLVGTGNKSKTGAMNTKSPIAGKPAATYTAGNVIKTGKATGAGNTKPLSPKKDDGFGSKGNINVKTGNVSVDLKGEGKPVGTGKGAPKGSVNAKPILPKK